MTTVYLSGDDLTQGILFMEAVEQWKKVGVLFKLKTPMKAVVILQNMI